METKEYFIENISNFREKALYWANSGFETYMLLNGNSYTTLHGPFPDLLAIGKKRFISADKDGFDGFEQLLNEPHTGLFGYLSYDLKNEIEDLQSRNADNLNFPDLCFFESEILIRFYSNKITIEGNEPEKVFSAINNGNHLSFNNQNTSIQVTQQTSQNEYLQRVSKIKEHIVEGDIYELNYCINFSGKASDINPVSLYLELNKVAPTPFSTLFKASQYCIISASPERFLKKSGSTIISQPMKGTIRRSKNLDEDLALANSLKSSEKEIAENMMIVDLVRNDLARSCKTGSVKVDDLFGIYQFPTVHQMISTVSGELKPVIGITDAVKNAYPMGSMTGAPKIRAMELIDQFETFKRGPFSGAAGYIAPNGDFDFNVLIRSLFYNSESNCLSFSVGSAITYDCIPEQEYNECMLKAEVLIKLLSQKS